MRNGKRISFMAAALGLLLVSQSPLESQSATVDEPKAAGLRRDVIVSIGQDAILKAGDTTPQIVVIGGSVTVNGSVDQDVVVVGGDAIINGDVGDNVVVIMGKVHLGPKALLHHDMVVVGGKAEIDPGATINGQTQEVAVGMPVVSFLRLEWLKSWVENCAMKFRPLSFNVGWVWWFVGGFFIVYLLIAVLFRHPVECCYTQLATRPATTIAAGILAKLLIPVMCVILPFTIIGIFVVPFIIVGAMLGMLVGKVALLEFLGRKVGAPLGFADGQRPILAFLIGFALITVLYLVPVLGFLTALAFSVWGFGGAVTAGWLALRGERRAASLPTAAPSVAPGSSPLGAPPVGADVPAGAPVITPPAAVLYPRAGFWERMGAGFLDLALLGVATALIGPFGLPLAIAYFSGMWAWKGTTIGGIVLNLQVVREDGRPLGFLTSFVRSVAALFSVATLFLGFFWIGWDSQKQGWHDKIAGTVVVRLPKAIALVCL